MLGSLQDLGGTYPDVRHREGVEVGVVTGRNPDAGHVAPTSGGDLVVGEGVGGEGSRWVNPGVYTSG